ncbi:MAG: ribosomal protein S18-alanine N-acetyltransferase [Lachnospiraceae bacterium]|nr:ribosomal protein S18-alanine N-acetyltransferase [Lachnospiraceae bacterium]
MRYRELAEADLSAAAELEGRNFSRPWSREAFAEALESDDYLYYVAEEDGHIVGLAGLVLTLPEGGVTNVSVAESCRRRGIAEGLLKELFSAGEKRGATELYLEVRASNAAAIGLYEKLGFVCEGRRKAFYSAPTEDALIYWKRGKA